MTTPVQFKHLPVGETFRRLSQPTLLLRKVTGKRATIVRAGSETVLVVPGKEWVWPGGGAIRGRRRHGDAVGGTLRPFSGPNYSRNSRRVGDDAWPCALCGRAVKTDDAKWVTVVDGGSRFVRAGEPTVLESDPGHMGGFAVGPDCARRLAKDNVLVE